MGVRYFPCMLVALSRRKSKLSLLVNHPISCSPLPTIIQKILCYWASFICQMVHPTSYGPLPAPASEARLLSALLHTADGLQNLCSRTSFSTHCLVLPMRRKPPAVKLMSVLLLRVTVAERKYAFRGDLPDRSRPDKTLHPPDYHQP